MKICKGCLINKNESDYYFNKKLNVYMGKCKDCIKKVNTNRQKNNRDLYYGLQVEWRKNNKDRIKSYKYVKTAENKKCVQIRKSIKLAIRRALYNKVQRRSIRYLGCTGSEYINYLSSKFKEGMSWENYGKWDIDHIVPQSSFDFKDKNNYYICFNFKNTQPLWKQENQLKGNKI
jgi:hypothetical protein